MLSELGREHASGHEIARVMKQMNVNQVHGGTAKSPSCP